MRRSPLAIVIAGAVVFPLVAIAADAPKGPSPAPSTSASAKASASSSASSAPSASTADANEPADAMPASIAAATNDANTSSTDTATSTAEASSTPPTADATPAKGPPRAAWHPSYAIEVEPHFVVAGFDKFGPGLGLGAHVAVPIWKNQPIHSIDDDLSFGVGVDVVRYAAYKPTDPIGDSLRVSAVYVPVFVQWNLWLGSRASIFLQPQVIFRFANYIDTCSVRQCADTTRTFPSGSIGLRFRIVDHVSATITVGWPMATLGASWL